MVGNHNRPDFHYLAGRFPGRVGHLYSPGAQRTPFTWLPYALDNGAWPAFKNGEEWEVSPFEALLDWAAKQVQEPRWVICPDKVGDASGTMRLWKQWSSVLREYGWPIAFAVQDGMVVAEVPPEVDVVFVGGTSRWKRRTLETWVRHFPRVHVGRVNHRVFLWRCAELGVESVDGTGWYHKNDGQLYALEPFFEHFEAGHRADPLRPLPLFTT